MQATSTTTTKLFDKNPN